MFEDMSECYRILEVPSGASLEEVKHSSQYKIALVCGGDLSCATATLMEALWQLMMRKKIGNKR